TTSRRPPLHHQAPASPSPPATTTSRLPQSPSPKSVVTYNNRAPATIVPFTAIVVTTRDHPNPSSPAHTRASTIVHIYLLSLHQSSRYEVIIR
ncbi:hypothetical protein KSS87_004871, partial [Heliosperma pusillum]